jgi:hypothetical protein
VRRAARAVRVTQNVLKTFNPNESKFC